jgi:outer membrane receptor for ferrienterochelin and colicins
MIGQRQPNSDKHCEAYPPSTRFRGSNPLYIHWRTKLCLMLASLLVLATLGHAQPSTEATPDVSATPAHDSLDLDFEELMNVKVYGASQYAQKVTEAPASVTIITADEIKKYGYRTLADILQSVNGFYVTNDRSYSYVGVRGFNRPGDYNSRVLLLVDGHRLNDNLYDQAGVGTESPIDIDLIDRVEIIRGPSSSLYGTNAVFGVINVIMKRGRDLNGTELSTEVGGYHSYKGRVTYGKRLSSDLEVLVSGAFYDSQGHRRLFYKEYDDSTTNSGVTRRADSQQSYNLFAKFTLRDLTLVGGYSGREKVVPTAPFGTVFPTTQTTDHDEHGYIDLKYEKEIAKGWELVTRLYYDRYYYRGNFLYDYSETTEPELVLNQDHHVGEWWGSEVRLSKRLWQKHRVTLGAEYRDNFRREFNNTDQNPFLSYLKTNKGSRNWAVFLQDEFSILDNLILNGSARYDYYDSFGGTVSPRVALIYNRWNTTFKLIYGQAFRAPNAYEQIYVAPGFKSNLTLDPEKITTYEAVIERTLGKNLRASMAGYYYTIDGLISQGEDPADGLLVFTNTESIAAKGIELGLDGHWRSGLVGRLSYAIQKTNNHDTGRQLTNSPQHMAKWNVIVPLLSDKLFAGIEARYLSSRVTLKGKNAGDYFVTNLTLFSHNVFSGAEMSASIYNLFGERYGDPGSEEHAQDTIRQNGRTFMLRLKYAF